MTQTALLQLLRLGRLMLRLAGHHSLFWPCAATQQTHSSAAALAEAVDLYARSQMIAGARGQQTLTPASGSVLLQRQTTTSSQAAKRQHA